MVLPALLQEMRDLTAGALLLAGARPTWLHDGEQQDCSEYITSLLAGLQEETNRPEQGAGGINDILSRGRTTVFTPWWCSVAGSVARYYNWTCQVQGYNTRPPLSRLRSCVCC